MDKNNMSLRRTIGIEMEGYINSYPSGVTIFGSSIGMDGSLRGRSWDDDDDDFYNDESHHDNGYGVEIRTEPFSELNNIYQMVSDMEQEGWHVDTHAGTHIHVDISDYNEKDKAKLLRFCKGIERVIFMFVEDYRLDNNYCRKIHKDWRKIFWKRARDFKDFNWETIESRGLNRYINDTVSHNNQNGRIWNGKYQWVNVLGSRFPTAEFRLFHAVRNAEELIAQAQLAYSIVELVKNTEVEQLEFIIKSIYAQDTVDEMGNKLFDALGLPFRMEIKGQEAYAYLVNKLNELNSEPEGETTTEVEIGR